MNCELTDGLSSCRQQQKQHQPGASPHPDHATHHDEGYDIIGWWLKDTLSCCYLKQGGIKGKHRAQTINQHGGNGNSQHRLDNSLPNADKSGEHLVGPPKLTVWETITRSVLSPQVKNTVAADFCRIDIQIYKNKLIWPSCTCQLLCLSLMFTSWG